MARPPPIVNAPILKKIKNILMSVFNCFIGLFSLPVNGLPFEFDLACQPPLRLSGP
jgi:hypothetical protein